MIVTGIYGGSFNPIHNGHTTLASDLCRQGEVDELWFVVSPRNPLKPDAELLDDRARLHMARLAVKGEPCLHVCDIEFGLPRPSFMVHTLEVLRNRYPGRRFVLVIGADNWLLFNRWHRYEDILRHHSLLIYPRSGYPVSAEGLPPTVRLVDTPCIDISSTQIRQAVATGGDASGWVCPAVWNEIRDKGYYGFHLYKHNNYVR